MQHGFAVDAAVDPNRPLTPEGRAEVVAVGAAARRAGVGVNRIIHSDKLRATQTARAVGEQLGCLTITGEAGLHPGDPVEPVAATWTGDNAPDSLLIVGHLPFLDRLASLLVGADPHLKVIAFRNAALVALRSTDSPGGFSVAWILTPELIGTEVAAG